MRHFLGVLIISAAIFSSAQATVSPLNESAREYEAILQSPQLQTVLSQSEFIFEMERKTKDPNASTVYYELETHKPSGTDPDHYHVKEYKVTLLITPNPQIGPPIITVDSITPEH